MTEQGRFVYPFQKIYYVGPRGNGFDILLAAAGSHIFSFDIPSGTLLGQWPSDSQDGKESDASQSDEWPAKRRKVAANGEGDVFSESSESVEFVAERVKGQRRKKKTVESKLPNVSHLVMSKDRKHIISVTAEDKCIRVFELRGNGKLRVLSSRRVFVLVEDISRQMTDGGHRNMPKRLCALILSPNESTILAGDKFGDVYALPLHISSDNPTLPPPGVSRPPAEEFTTSATELTVHTKGNLEALRQQREQRNVVKRKEGPVFNHKLLLGHVSLLTDLIITELNVGTKLRQYILTADRDEHIRVSRGLEQAHMIENYCHGHKEFVSKISILPWAPEILVAGSGESSIKTYHWRKGEIAHVEEFGLRLFKQAIFKELAEQGEVRNLAVSGLWTIQAAPTEPWGFVLVALEG